ncbi:jg471, partial [Pararge aegeria aegeria]
VLLLLITCGIVQSSGVHQLTPAGGAPIVTAASSQYFERTFNRLVPAPPLLEPVLPFAPAPMAPVFPVAPAPPRPILSVLPIAPAPPVVVEATRTTSVPVNPTNPPLSAGNPNIAIAIATAHAAAPVATILLPPYPFGFPPSFGLLPQAPQTPSDPNNREATTLKTTTTVQATKTQREDATTPVPSNIDNSFAQALPSDVNIRQYLAPQLPVQGARPQQPVPRPQDPNQIPQQFPVPNQRPQQFPRPDQRPEEFPGPNQRPPQFPRPDQRPQEFPGPNQRPQQFPRPDQRPQEFPGPNQRPQKFPGSDQRPQQFPGANPRPQQFPGSNQRPQQFPGPDQRPQQFPLPKPWPHHMPEHLPLPNARPIKLKTNVEVVPVPLAYIAPPSLHHNHQHHHNHLIHQSLKLVPHIHTFIPKTSKIIIRPVTGRRVRTVRKPAGYAIYGSHKLVRRVASKYSQNDRSSSRDIEPITRRPIDRPFTKPPRF